MKRTNTTPRSSWRALLAKIAGAAASGSTADAFRVVNPAGLDAWFATPSEAEAARDGGRIYDADGNLLTV